MIYGQDKTETPVTAPEVPSKPAEGESSGKDEGSPTPAQDNG